MANKKDDIAIIGMACRFPGQSDNIEKFWELLLSGRDGIQQIPPNHFNMRAFYTSPDSENKINSPYAGCIENIEKFDAEFFKITPKEAVMMDPQQRILLETSWHAFENAFINPKSLKKSDTSFFVGAASSDYFRILEKYGTEEDFNLYLSTGNALSAVAGHLSYFYGTHGQSIAIDTACSSSLVTIHHAVQELRLGRSHIAVAAGVNIILDPVLNMCFSKAQMLSKEGRCKTFDDSANGYVRSEGCGVIVLKRLADALQDNNRILAVIKGAAVNQDGASNGFTAPSAQAQIQLYEQALSDAQLSGNDIGYIEAHGTGTKLGDPIEMKSITAVYGKNRLPAHPLVIGALKSNIGHLEAAAGIAGIIKTVLMLQHETITPNLHFKTLNQYINLEACQGVLALTCQPWAKGSVPRRAGISSFGFSGTNAHLILEEPPTIPALEHQKIASPYYLILLSAKTEKSLQLKINQLKDYILQNPSISLGDIAYTLACSHTHFEKRAALVVCDREDLINQLSEKTSFTTIPSTSLKTAFLFTGQGSQYPRMALGLYESSPLFKDYFDECVQALQPYLSEDVFDLLTQEPTSLHQTRYTQPLLWAVEVALAKLWINVGVNPDAVIGHSVGEYAAATIAGVLTLDEAARLITARGKLMYDLPSGGGMLAVMGDNKHFLPFIQQHSEDVQIAACNTPTQIVLAGDLVTLNKLALKAKEYGLITHQLDVSHGFHSSLMEPMMMPFTDYFKEIPARLPHIPFYSNLTGEEIEKPVDASYWVHHVRDTVQFSQAIEKIQTNKIRLLVEIGPKPILLGFAGQNLTESFVSVPSLTPKNHDFQTVCEGLKTLYLHDVPVNWKQFYAPFVCQFVDLPLYPFDHQSYWADSFRKYLEENEHETIAVLPSSSNPIKEGSSLLSVPSLDHIQGPLSKEIIRQRVIYNLRKTMGLRESDPIAEEKNFLEIGIDSLMAIQFKNLLQAELSIYRPKLQLPNTIIFNYPTIQKVCDYIGELIEKTPDASPLQIASLSEANSDIAVIGIGCHFPGGNKHPEQFWNFLCAGKDGVMEVPDSRPYYKSYCYPSKNVVARIASPWGGFLDNIDHFDPAFFSISPREAELMDPQHRLLLETCWQALESACLDANTLKGKDIGLFVGIGSTDYATLLFKTAEEDKINPYYATGNALSMAAGHISYLFGWEGPSMAIDTSCSSSLVAIHQAVKSLRENESEIAFVGGVNLTLLPDLSIALSSAQMLSKDGRCKTFDAGANGYVRSEGCGIVVLKPLTEAIKDGNRIFATIKGSAVNQDGASNGLTAPNGLAQEKLYKKALTQSSLKGADVHYIEAHGTGTKLGDPIEMSSIGAIYGKDRTEENPLIIGSVKSNIGHMEAAAGIGSFIKAVLSLHYEKIPPHLHLKSLNPLIDLKGCQGMIPTHCMPWKRNNTPRRAAVSAFGFSGTNAHIILEEAPFKQAPVKGKSPYYFIPLSAKTPESLQQKIQQFITYLQQNPEQSLDNISYTLTNGRTHFENRIAFVVTSLADLLHQLEENPAIVLNDPLSQPYEEIKQTYLKGNHPDGNKIFESRSYDFIDLPFHPFNHKSYWAEPLQNLKNETFDVFKSDIQEKSGSIPSHQNIVSFNEKEFKNWLGEQVSLLLKIPTKEISTSKNLYQYGIDSLTAMEIEARIEKKYGCHLPASVFMQTPTIESLTQVFKEKVQQSSNLLKSSNLILLNGVNNSQSPVFFIHPASGNTLCYVEISKLLGQKRPLYAIEQSPLSLASPIKTVTEYAQEYLHQIKQIQPHGPYTLLGWSLGGTIAHEMAFLLEQEGQEIFYLGMFDSYIALPHAGEDEETTARKLKKYFLQEFAFTFQVSMEIANFQPQEIYDDAYIDKIIKLCANSPFFASHKDLASIRQVLIHCFLNMDTLALHIPSILTANIHFFQATEKTPYADAISFSSQAQILQWIHTTKGVFHQYQLPGNHYSILNSPQVDLLANYLLSVCR